MPIKKITQQQIDALLQTIWTEGIKTTTFDAIRNLLSGLPVIEEEIKKPKTK
jgi:hypothetical protein